MLCIVPSCLVRLYSCLYKVYLKFWHKQSCQPVRIFRISYGNQTRIRRYGSVLKNTHFGKSRKRYIITRNIDKLVSRAGCWNARFYSTETCHARCASSVQSGLHEILTVIIPTWRARVHACRRCCSVIVMRNTIKDTVSYDPDVA